MGDGREVMAGVTETAIGLQADQVLGYWGNGQAEALKLLLDTLLNQIGSTPFNRHQLTTRDSRMSWGVAIAGARSVAVSHATTVVITASASGLHGSPDAWITLQSDRLTLAREAFGRSPLYWLQQGNVIWFASRFQWLLSLLESPKISVPGVYGYACFSYVPTPITPIAGIFSLAAGTEQTWTVHQTGELVHSCQRLLEWQESPVQLNNEEQAIAHLQTLLQQSVQAQIADLENEPVGVLLSGGLDSSIVAALLVQAGVKVRAYTLNFGEAGIPETPYAEQVAQFLQIPLVTVDARPKQIRRALLSTAQALDLPFGDGVTVPLFLLTEAASRDVPIIFNGEGGDQLFAGWTNKPLIAAGVYQTEQPIAQSFTEQYLRTFHRLWGYEAQLFQPEIYTQVKAQNPQAWLDEALNPQFCPSLLHQLRRATLMLKGAQNIHPRATNLARAQGLRVRSPFCDLELAEFAFQMSSDLHLRGSCEKYILKRAVSSWLPSEIVWRPKRGMGVPLTAWCLSDLWHDLGRWLNPATLKQGGIWQPDIAHQILVGKLGTIQGRRIGESLWLLLMWQLWGEVTLGNPSRYSLDHPFWLPPWLGRPYLRFRKGLDP